MMSPQCPGLPGSNLQSTFGTGVAVPYPNECERLAPGIQALELTHCGGIAAVDQIRVLYRGALARHHKQTQTNEIGVTQFLSLLPEIWPWLILATAQVAAFAGRSALSLSLLALFGMISLIIGLMSLLATALVGIGLLGAFHLRRQSGWSAAIGHIALILWCLALGAHLLPGFNNLRILDQVTSGVDSSAFTMFLNVDKPTVLFAVLLVCPGMLNSHQRTRIASLILGIGFLPLLSALGFYFGAVRLELGLPSWWLIFAFSNLFLTCLAEEAFFRGYLQALLASKIGAAWGIAVASLLFGLAHIGGGPELVAFAALLGMGLGLAYFATGRLWVPVAMHFGFNFLHLALFTYPGPI